MDSNDLPEATITQDNPMPMAAILEMLATILETKEYSKEGGLVFEKRTVDGEIQLRLYGDLTLILRDKP